jgi:hypothetical protein
MDKEKEEGMPVLEVPSAGEMDVLHVLWTEHLGSDQALQLSEIHRRVCERRRQLSDPEPALTTTSSQLKSLSEKKLIGADSPSAAPRPVVRTRGGLTPASRASASNYRALHPPGDVLFGWFKGLIAAYPQEKRLESLLDFARALGVSAECLHGLQEVVEREKGRGSAQAK